MDAVTKFSDKKREQEKARRAKELPEQVKRLEGRINALETALAEHAARLDKLEVVKVPSPTTTEPELPFEDQRPETE